MSQYYYSHAADGVGTKIWLLAGFWPLYESMEVSEI